MMSSNHIVNVLTANFDKLTFSDFEVKVENKSIHVHKAHLQMASEYLRAMVSEHWCHKSEVEITDYPYEVVYRYLKYLYTGQIEITGAIIEKLYDLANCYLEKDLMKRCEDFMCKQLTPANLPLYYQLASKYSCSAFKLNLVAICKQSLTKMYPAAIKANLTELKDALEVYMRNNINSSNIDAIWSLAITYNHNQVKNAAERFFEEDVNRFGYHYSSYSHQWNKNRQYNFYYQIATEHKMHYLQQTLDNRLIASFRKWCIKNNLSNLDYNHRVRINSMLSID